MSQKESWQDWFYLNKRERRGYLVLFFILFGIMIAPKFFNAFKPKPQERLNYDSIMNQLTFTSIEGQVYEETNQVKDTSTKEIKESHTNSPAIERYEENEDHSDSRASEPPTNSKLQTASIPNSESRITKEQKKEKPQLQIILVNKATASDFSQFRGIGPVLSERIISFRNALGGFYSVEQVGETYGIEPEVFQRMKPSLQIQSSPQIRKISINSATLDQLKSHPYISPKLAEQMLNYREKVHPFSGPEDLKALYFVDDEIFRKLNPYIKYD